MRGFTLIEFVIVCAIVGILVALAAGLVYDARGQDVVCYDQAGKQILFAEGVRVHQGDSGLTIRWPDGRRRTILSGHCEWAPHGQPYQAEEVESWKSPPEDRTVRWASR